MGSTLLPQHSQHSHQQQQQLSPGVPPSPGDLLSDPASQRSSLALLVHKLQSQPSVEVLRSLREATTKVPASMWSSLMATVGAPGLGWARLMGGTMLLLAVIVAGLSPVALQQRARPARTTDPPPAAGGGDDGADPHAAGTLFWCGNA